jgi:DNA-binding transcriptional ArsR family regulator
MPDEKLSRDRVFDILSSPRRRYVLYYLREYGGPVELTDLAEELAAWENDTTVSEISPQARKRVYVSLYQTHVPKLDEAGLIEYDSDSGELWLSDQGSVVDPYLGTQSDDTPWYKYYFALALASLTVSVAVVGGLAQLSISMLIGAIVGGFLLLTAVHTVSRVRAEETGTEFDEF